MADPLDDAAQSLGDFANGTVPDAMTTIENAVAKSFNAVAATIARAAVSGKTSIDQLVSAILADFERVAISQFIVKPIEGLVGSLAGDLGQAIGGGAAARGAR